MFLAFPSQGVAAVPTYQHCTLIKDVSAWDRPSSWKQGHQCFSGAGIPPASVKHICVRVPCFVDLRQALFLNWIIFLSRGLLWFMNIRVHTFFIFFFWPKSQKKKVPAFFTPASLLPQSHGASQPQTGTHGESSALLPEAYVGKSHHSMVHLKPVHFLLLDMAHLSSRKESGHLWACTRERHWGPNPQDLITWHPSGTPSMDSNHHDFLLGNTMENPWTHHSWFTISFLHETREKPNLSVEWGCNLQSCFVGR